jgi:hypothetical protein
MKTTFRVISCNGSGDMNSGIRHHFEFLIWIPEFSIKKNYFYKSFVTAKDRECNRTFIKKNGHHLEFWLHIEFLEKVYLYKTDTSKSWVLHFTRGALKWVPVTVGESSFFLQFPLKLHLICNAYCVFEYRILPILHTSGMQKCFEKNAFMCRKKLVTILDSGTTLNIHKWYI